MKIENEQKPPKAYKEDYQVVMDVFAENLPRDQHLKRFLELKGNANLPLVSDNSPQSKVQLMECLQKRFNLSLTSPLLAHLFDLHGNNLKLR
jgi:hypothetical protein